MSIFLIRAWSIRLWGHPESFQTYAPPSTTPYFTDISTSDFAFPYMQKMKELTITAGCNTGTTFCPDSTLTNFDSTILTVRARQASDLGCTTSCSPDTFAFTATPADFADLPVSTNPPFKWAQRAVSLGIYSPSVALPNCPTVGNFCQTAPVSRGQMALLVQSGVLGQTTPTIGAVMPAGITSIADTMMFVTTMAASASYASVIIENNGTYSANANVVPANACYVQYLASSNALFLGTDGLSQSSYWVNYPSGPWTPGAQGQISNSRCTLDLTRSYVQTSGNQLTLHLALTFQPSWSGVKEMYFAAADSNSSTLAWTNRGNWTVPAFSQVPVTADHYDVFRTGATVHETKLTPANVTAQLGIVGRLPITACAWAQPLYVPGVTINGVTKNVLYVATADAVISAFDAATIGTAHTTLWTRSLGSTPADFGDGDIVNCATSSGSQGRGPAGIVGTPVIDLSSNTMYVVGNTGVLRSTTHKIFAISIATGLDSIPAVTVTDPAGTFVSPSQNQRSGLLLAEYNVIIPYASYYDNPAWNGWMFNYSTGNLARQDSWNYSPNVNGTSIWMSGGGAAFDGNRVYVTTGNNFDQNKSGDSDPIGFSNSLLQLNPYGRGGVGLGQVNQFLPPQATRWLKADLDLGSSRAILLPGTNFVATGGKAGNIYLLDRTAPIAGPSNPTSTTATGGSLKATFNIVPGKKIEESSFNMFGGLAYWNGLLYSWAGNDTVGCIGDILRSFSVAQALAGGTPQTQSTGGVSCEQGAPLSISANYDLSGILWAVLPSANEHLQQTQVVGGHLYAFDAMTLAQLYTSDLGGDGIQKFTAPVVANGKVYVVTSSHEILIYGLLGQ